MVFCSYVIQCQHSQHTVYNLVTWTFSDQQSAVPSSQPSMFPPSLPQAELPEEEEVVFV